MTETEDTRTFIRFLATFLQSLRRTIEIPFEAQLRQKNDSGARLLREILRDIESARLSIAPIRSTAYRPVPLGVSRYLATLSNELRGLCENSDYAPLLKSVRFRMLPQAGPRDPTPASAPRFAEGSTAYDAIQSALGEIAAFANPPGTGQQQRDLFELRAIVPDQKIAPAQFEIRDDRLAIRKFSSTFRKEDQESVLFAKTELCRNGDRIIRELQQSNCDRRLLENIQHLQSHLSDEINAIKIGLTNISCEFMCSAFEQELPAAVASMLRAHTRGVQLFVGQFPEWNRFLENAATAHLENDDIGQVKGAAEQLIATLKSQPNVVDPEVPKTLAFLTRLLDEPLPSAKRAAFAILRSMENLISLVFRHGADFGQKTMSKTIETASGAASKIIVAALLSIALSGATALGPIANKLPEMNWLQSATQIVKKQLEDLAGK